MLSTISNQAIQPSVQQSAIFGKKLFCSFKKAAWIASTTSLILLIPLIIEMDREQQIIELEKEQMSVLTGNAGAK
ncbi:hypothetical protein DUNSADRAFT_6348 [Dunaliella salina]|uniref:Mitochondrial import receptor subunit TOM22 n=1 Tax=Dunaliella salina TaxID=3046 RepID=A0ABQ7GNF0_DUNSA|nr:hypothetical protein DUNSADRAFT_6348 [Dunaliella salina]|eukprot:KAF5836145.1 hypothetical protein DUNSADRAFT_6348 [Dunaliella salina]